MPLAELWNPGGWVGGALPPGFRISRPTVTHSLPQCNPIRILHPTNRSFRSSGTRKRHSPRANWRWESGARTFVDGARHAANRRSGTRLAGSGRFRPGGVRRGRGSWEMTPTTRRLGGGDRELEHQSGTVLGRRRAQPPAVERCHGGRDRQSAPTPAATVTGAPSQLFDRCRQPRPIIDDLDADAGRAGASPHLDPGTAVLDCVRDQIGGRLPEAQRVAAHARQRFATGELQLDARLGRDRPPGADRVAQQRAEINGLDLARSLACLRRMRRGRRAPASRAAARNRSPRAARPTARRRASRARARGAPP